MPLRLDARAADFEARFAAFLGAKREAAEDVDAVVAASSRMCASAAMRPSLEYTERFDGVDLRAEDMRVSAADMDRPSPRATPATLAAFELAAERIRAFHERQRPTDLDFTDGDGVRLGWRWTPIAAIGLYVPGGTAAYPSSVLMNALPAKVAGCERLVMTVPAPRGELNPLVLAAARIAGVDEVYRIGGAQAIAALAYGTDDDRAGRQDRRTGQRLCRGGEAPGLRAGRDRHDRRAVGGADRRRRRERSGLDRRRPAGAGRTRSGGAVDPDHRRRGVRRRRRRAAWSGSCARLPRRDIAAASWREHGCVILVATCEDAPPLIDRLAPEHLQLAVDDAIGFAARVRNAGSIFLGRFTPEALGDYVAGPNHVLPTSRSARFSSGLGVLDFMKRSTFLGCDADGLARLARRRSAWPKPRGCGRTPVRLRFASTEENRTRSRHSGSVTTRSTGPVPRAKGQGPGEVREWSISRYRPPNLLATGAADADRERIIKVVLEEQNRIRLSPTVEHERKAALYDLIQDNKFVLKGAFHGPYILHLGNDGERLTSIVCDEDRPAAYPVLASS